MTATITNNLNANTEAQAPKERDWGTIAATAQTIVALNKEIRAAKEEGKDASSLFSLKNALLINLN